jgi:hypothetical protein
MLKGFGVIDQHLTCKLAARTSAKFLYQILTPQRASSADSLREALPHVSCRKLEEVPNRRVPPKALRANRQRNESVLRRQALAQAEDRSTKRGIAYKCHLL